MNEKQRKTVVRIIGYLKAITYISFIAAAIVLSISTILNFTFDDREVAGEPIVFVVTWCVAMFSFFVILYGTPILLLIAVYFKTQKTPVWQSLKKEFLLLLLILSLVGLFLLSISYWREKYIEPVAIERL